MTHHARWRPLRRFGSLVLAALAITCGITLAPAYAAGSWQLADVARIAAITQLQALPGDRFAFTVERANLNSARYETSSWWVGGADTVPPMAAPEDDGTLSPDGRQWLIVQISIDSSLAVKSVNGGKPKVLVSPQEFSEIFDASWSPDGKWIAYVLDDGIQRSPAWRFGAYVLDQRASLTETSPRSDRHIWVVSSDGSARHELTLDKYTYGESAPRWTADGRFLITTRSQTGLANDTSKQWVKIDASTGETTVLPGSTNCTDVLTSGSGERLASLCPVGGDPVARVDVMVDGVDLTGGLDLNATGAQWLADGSLVASIQDGLATRLYRLTSDGAAPYPLTPPSIHVERFVVSADGGAIAYVASSETQPSELFTMSLDGSHVRQVTHLNDELNAPAPVAPQVVTWSGPFGKTLSGLVFAPPDASSTTPLIVWVVGPRDAVNIGFDAPAQYFVSHGYTVFEPNARGSTAYGDWSGKSLVGDWVNGPQSDIEDGIGAVERLALVDPKRRFLLGLRDGGYTAAWLIGHTNSFAAAVSGFGFTSLPLYYAYSDHAYMVARYFGSEPLARAAQLLVKESPITYVDQVTTPTLFFAAYDDKSTPIETIYPMYRRLVDRHVPTVLWRYGGGLSPVDQVPEERLYIILQIAQWFGQYGGIKIDECMPGSATPVQFIAP